MQTRIRSRAGVAASAIFLSLLPAAIVYQAFLASGVEIFIHLLIAAGCAVLAPAVLDFRTPPWIKWPAFLAAILFSFIVLFQALSLSVNNKSLHDAAFNLLGQGVEAMAGNVILLWFVAVLRYDSDGRTRILGSIVVALAVGNRIFQYTSAAYMMSEAVTETFKLFLLLPFIWLLLESRKRTPAENLNAKL